MALWFSAREKLIEIKGKRPKKERKKMAEVFTKRWKFCMREDVIDDNLK
jgi:hypothetical protein